MNRHLCVFKSLILCISPFLGPVASLRHKKDDVTSVKKDMECGLRFKKPIEYQPGDVIVCYDDQEVPQKIQWDLGFWWWSSISTKTFEWFRFICYVKLFKLIKLLIGNICCTFVCVYQLLKDSWQRATALIEMQDCFTQIKIHLCEFLVVYPNVLLQYTDVVAKRCHWTTAHQLWW